MSDDTYEGWPNRETWAANLHLANDESLYRMVIAQRDAIAAAAEDGKYEFETAQEYTRNRLAERLADFFEELALGDEFGPPSEADRMMLYDIGSLWRVEWTHIAEYWMED